MYKHTNRISSKPRANYPAIISLCLNSCLKKDSFTPPTPRLRRLAIKTAILHNVGFKFICIELYCVFIEHLLSTYWYFYAFIHPIEQNLWRQNRRGQFVVSQAQLLFVFSSFLPPAFFLLLWLSGWFHFEESFLHFSWSVWLVSQ